jgi:hypothetical protein
MRPGALSAFFKGWFHRLEQNPAKVLCHRGYACLLGACDHFLGLIPHHQNDGIAEAAWRLSPLPFHPHEHGVM